MFTFGTLQPDFWRTTVPGNVTVPPYLSLLVSVMQYKQALKYTFE